MKKTLEKTGKKTAKVFKYQAVFEPDLEVGGYTVSIPVLPGCISEGDTYEEALENIKEAAELYLESLEIESEKLILKNKNKGCLTAFVEIKI